MNVCISLCHSVRGFVHSPNPLLLPRARIGTKYSGLLHAVDMYRSMLSLANVTLPSNPDDPTGGGTGPVAFDGYDQLASLQSGDVGQNPRKEILYAPIVPTLNPEDCTSWGQACGGALRVGRYKLIMGYPGDSRVLPLPASETMATKIAQSDNVILGITAEERRGLNGDGGGPGPDGCDYKTGNKCPCHHLNGGPCLFDIESDPTESHDLARNSSFALLIADMTARLLNISATHVPPAGLVGDVLHQDCAVKCTKVQALNAFEPYGQLIPWATNWTNNYC